MQYIKNFWVALILAVGAVLTIMTVCPSVCKASSKIAPYTYKKVERYDSYKHINDSDDSYYLIGGHKYNEDSVRLVTSVSSKANHEVSVTVSKPVIKPHLTAHQKTKLKDNLIDWKQDNTYVSSPLDSAIFSITSDYNDWSLNKLFKDYQQYHTHVVINK